MANMSLEKIKHLLTFKSTIKFFENTSYIPFNIKKYIQHLKNKGNLDISIYETIMNNLKKYKKYIKDNKQETFLNTIRQALAKHPNKTYKEISIIENIPIRKFREGISILHKHNEIEPKNGRITKRVLELYSKQYDDHAISFITGLSIKRVQKIKSLHKVKQSKEYIKNIYLNKRNYITVLGIFQKDFDFESCIEITPVSTKGDRQWYSPKVGLMYLNIDTVKKKQVISFLTQITNLGILVNDVINQIHTLVKGWKNGKHDS